jgi:hypothetical protein
MAATTANLKIDDNDYERIITLCQTAAGVTPVKRLMDDGDVSAAIIALQTAAGVPVSLRLDRKDWAAKLIAIQTKLNLRTATISIATPAVVTLAAHGWVAGQGFQFSTTGALPAPVVAGTTYYVISAGLAAGTFQFAATQGGTAINTTGGTQSGVHSVYPQ